MRKLLFFILLLAPATAFAQRATLESGQVASLNLITTAIDAACDADPTVVATGSLACAAFQLKTAGFTKVWLLIEITHSAATSLEVSQDSAVDILNDGIPDLPWGIAQASDGAAPPAVGWGDEEGTRPVTASTSIVVEYNVNAPWTRWRFSGTSADGSDQVRVWVLKRGP